MHLPSTGDPRTSHPILAGLHDLVADARRANGRLRDPDAVAIHALFPADLDDVFGRAWPLHGARAHAIDGLTRRFIEDHGDAIVVELGAGLSTQCFRTPGAQRWLAVDSPSRIDLRDSFIHEDRVLRHVSCAPLNPRWLQGLSEGPTLVLAQGLFQPLSRDDAETLARRIADRLPGSTLLFDALPRRCRVSGGARRRDPHLTPRRVQDTVRRWIPGAAVRVHPFADSPVIEAVWTTLGEPALLRNHLPAIVEVTLP